MFFWFFFGSLYSIRFSYITLLWSSASMTFVYTISFPVYENYYGSRCIATFWLNVCNVAWHIAKLPNRLLAYTEVLHVPHWMWEPACILKWQMVFWNHIMHDALMNLTNIYLEPSKLFWVFLACHYPIKWPEIIINAIRLSLRHYPHSDGISCLLHLKGIWY